MNPDERLANKRQELRDKKSKEFERRQDQSVIRDSSKKIQQTIKEESTKSRSHTQPVEVKNIQQWGEVFESAKKASEGTLQAAQSILQTANTLEPNITSKTKSALVDTVKKLETIVGTIKDIEVKTDSEIVDGLSKLSTQISNLKLDPQISVASPDIQVSETKVDFTPLENILKEIEKHAKKFKVEVPGVDLEPLVKEIGSVKRAINELEFPIPNYVLPFKDSDGKATQVTLTDDNELPISLKGLEIPAYDYIGITYVSGGNGDGEIETVTYKTGGSGGSTVATLTLAYDGDDRLSSVTKS